MSNSSERGAIPILVLVSAIGLIAFMATSSVIPLKDKLLSSLYPKPDSYAVSGPISGPIDTIAPVVTITNPANNSFVRKNTSVNITAGITDNIDVVGAEFFVNGVSLCIVKSAPYSCSWKVPKQTKVSYLITVKAFDSAGNIGNSSVTVTSR